MAAWDRAGRGYGTPDEVDEYLRNEYRAEQGAYLERRPAYARSADRDDSPSFWAPRVAADYYVEEGFARGGTGALSDEPLYRSERAPGYEDRMRSDDRWRRDEHYRQRPSRHHARSIHDQWEQDRRAGRGLLRASENFYENLAGAVGLEPDASERHHRGRGPRNYRRSDERIQDDVNQRLTDDPYLDASDIEVLVRDQEVTLSGMVHSRLDKRRAEDIAESVSGVAHVQNNLRVRPEGSALR
ncbi:BON domain-containing protein [Microvirga lenta]|uniref:BON domain-containing protein n=1 Tax=Microvirga lenta TaxID=2881337 RepID=UPI001CFFEC17|nr:BON domain-containing protein [Microvirga lenta]MCB5177061.1 BON domain-containing protein [Microvirga lenta]